MYTIDARELNFKELNARVRQTRDKKITIINCVGQRFIGDALSGKKLEISGIPGNALGAFLDGADIVVHGNVQDATGNTMNDGAIVVHGSSGDATGYGMRGGRIFIRDNTGYRAGIHMKAYKEKLPVIVIGGGAGSFLGEYQAGGLILVLGIGADGQIPVGNFCGTGMHGGKIVMRCDREPAHLPKQVVAKEVEDLNEIRPYISEFCDLFAYNEADIAGGRFYALAPNTKNPYRQLYTHT
jgi:glutamate synthase domain-containing protein 3